MDISKELLVKLVRNAAESAKERAAVANAFINANWLVDLFVEEARAEGVSWAELASALSGELDETTPIKADSPTGRPTAPTVRRHDGKYRPLWQYLKASDESRLDLTFDGIEQILGFTLPPSSRRYQSHWYGYEGSAVVRAIVDAGWRASKVNLVDETVTLSNSTSSDDA